MKEIFKHRQIPISQKDPYFTKRSLFHNAFVFSLRKHDSFIKSPMFSLQIPIQVLELTLPIDCSHILSLQVFRSCQENLFLHPHIVTRGEEAM